MKYFTDRFVLNRNNAKVFLCAIFFKKRHLLALHNLSFFKKNISILIVYMFFFTSLFHFFFFFLFLFHLFFFFPFFSSFLPTSPHRHTVSHPPPPRARRPHAGVCPSAIRRRGEDGVGVRRSHDDGFLGRNGRWG